MTKYKTLAVVALFSISLLPSSVVAAETAGVMMKDGKMVMMETTGPMQHEMTMKNGCKVMPDGTVKMPDGKEMRLKDGEMMTMDGKVMESGKGMGMEGMQKGMQGMHE